MSQLPHIPQPEREGREPPSNLVFLLIAVALALTNILTVSAALANYTKLRNLKAKQEQLIELAEKKGYLTGKVDAYVYVLGLINQAKVPQ